MKSITRFLVVVGASMVLLAGCESTPEISGFEEFYTKEAPITFEPTNKVYMFDYGAEDIEEIYNMFFSDFLIIGKSAFNGGWNDPAKEENFAKSVGADVFISCENFTETRTYTYSAPTTSTTTVKNSLGYTVGTASTTSYETRTGSVDRYDEDAYYLKNVSHIVPIFEKTSADFNCTDDAGVYAGTWHDDDYRIRIQRSGNSIVGFIWSSKRSNWNEGNLKFIFDESTGEGVYMMGSKAPMPATFSINKFGFLEVKLGLKSDSRVFSFAKD